MPNGVTSKWWLKEQVWLKLCAITQVLALICQDVEPCEQEDVYII
jgi:hypothetical protein